MTTKTPEQIAEEAMVTASSGWHAAPLTEHHMALITSAARLAIEADRAQREQFAVVANHGPNMPEAIVGYYGTEFVAAAVAKEWNRVNGQYGIRYTAEEA